MNHTHPPLWQRNLVLAFVAVGALLGGGSFALAVIDLRQGDAELRETVGVEFDRRTAERDAREAEQDARIRDAVCLVIADLQQSDATAGLAASLGCLVPPPAAAPPPPSGPTAPAPGPSAPAGDVPPAPSPAETPRAADPPPPPPGPPAAPPPSPRPPPCTVGLLGTCLIP